MVTAAPYGWMRRRWRRDGDVFSSNFPYYGRVVYVADPAEVKQVFAGDPTIFHAGEANALALGDVLGDHSLLTLDDERHLSQRKLLLPPFHGESVRRYTEVMADATAREVSRWPLHRVIALRPRMKAITLEVIFRAVFGVREGERMVKETLRVRPVVVDVARKLMRDTEVAGYRLRAGTIVLPAIAVVHGRPDLYPSPREFRPERFLDGRAASYAWIPFGGGVRRCIGTSFAQVEMKVVLREVLRRVRLRAASRRPERPRTQHVTVVPSRGARVVVEERLAEPAASARDVTGDRLAQRRRGLDLGETERPCQPGDRRAPPGGQTASPTRTHPGRITRA